MTIDINNLPDLLVPREVAQIFKVTILTIRRWSFNGTLPFVRINTRGYRRYTKEAVLKLLEKRNG